MVWTVDACEEGGHFDRRWHPPVAIGRRAVAAAASDLAAMGAAPVASLISLVVGEDREAARAAAAAGGERAAEVGAPVVGGNITAGSRLALHVTVLGVMEDGVEPLRRDRARPGDGLFVTGPLGGAALGLSLLAGGTQPEGDREEAQELIRRQLDPEPRIGVGKALAVAAAAALDLSDGLARDLHRLASASGVGALVEEARVPVAGRGSAGRKAALYGGEDYELLVTGRGNAFAAAAAVLPAPGLIRIGSITSPDSGVRLRRPGGAVEILPDRGWDALSGSRSRESEPGPSGPTESLRDGGARRCRPKRGLRRSRPVTNGRFTAGGRPPARRRRRRRAAPPRSTVDP